MSQERNQNLDNFLMLRPFPQFETGVKKLPELWSDYRKKFIPLAGIAIFVFGNKRRKDSEEIIFANGMQEEFDIAIASGLKVIPIGATGFLAQELWNYVIKDFEKFYPEQASLKEEMELLGNEKLSNKELIELVIKIINNLNKK